MKRFIFLFILSLLVVGGFHAVAQSPAQQNNTLIILTAASWDNNCGLWGNPILEDMAANSTDTLQATYVSIHPNFGHGAQDSASNNWTLFNQVSNDWGKAVDSWSYPSFFSANFVDQTHTIHYTGDIPVNCMNIRDSFSAASVLGATGFTFKISNDTVKVSTRTKFYTSTTGDYYVGVYLIEDSVYHEQISYSGGMDYMRNVVRASMSSSGSSWGDEIVNGAPHPWQFFDKDFTYAITDPSWNISKLKAIAILFRKSGGTYTFINCAYGATPATADPAAVANIQTNNDLISIYPNPASGNTNISIALEKNTKANIKISDLTGRLVYNSGDLFLTAGNNRIPVSTANFNPGLYNVIISTEDGNITKQLSIAK